VVGTWLWAGPEPSANSDEMKLPPGFAERLAEKTDEQLCEMVAQAQDYLPEALEAARTELCRRNLTPERMAEAEAAFRAKLAERVRVAEEPLSVAMRLLIVFGVCATFWLPLYYKANGQRRKAKESWRWLGYAYLFYFALAALTVIIRKLAAP